MIVSCKKANQSYCEVVELTEQTVVVLEAALHELLPRQIFLRQQLDGVLVLRTRTGMSLALN